MAAPVPSPTASPSPTPTPTPAPITVPIPTTATSQSTHQDRSAQYFLRSSLAGGVSGCVAKTLVAPLDRVKILFQGYRPDYMRHAGSPFGVFRALRQIYETQGPGGLFQGHSAMLLRIFPSAAIRFMAYEQFRMTLIPTKDKATPWRHFLAGSLAGNTAVLVTYPFEVIRSRLAYEIRHQAELDAHALHRTTSPLSRIPSVPSPSTATHAATKVPFTTPPLTPPLAPILPRTFGILPTVRIILQENNGSFRGFYKGFGATMWGIVPYAGAAFMFYEWAKQKTIDTLPFAVHTQVVRRLDSSGDGRHSHLEEKQQLNVWAHLLVGGVAGLLGQTVSYPFDTVRHRMQLHGVAEGIPKYRHTWDAIRSIWIRESWRGFFVGLSINYWKTMPANAIAFVVYDSMKNLLKIE